MDSRAAEWRWQIHLSGLGSFFPVVGYWAYPSYELADVNSPLLCERFVNWPETPEKIVAFTRKYGPLLQRPCFTREGKGHAFSFRVDEWRASQVRLKKVWGLKSPFPDFLPDGLAASFRRSLAGRPFVDRGTVVSIQPDERLQFLPGKATLRVNTLFRLMEMEVCACPRAYLKVCRFCGTCFIEPDKRVVYCGKRKCRIQGKNESNRIAWHRNKAKWTKKRTSD